MKTPPAIRLGSLGDDISKKDLQNIVERFIHLNQSHLQRIQSFLQPRQHIFLDLLPLLFHQNNPLLPGFNSPETIAGIPNYQPSANTLTQARSLAENFIYQPLTLTNPPIQAIYLMGSVSSIAFAQHSDIDIWLCHDHKLLPTEIDDLQDKATAIEQWAESLELEVHFYLVDSQAPLKGASSPLPSDNSAPAQHYLLLEEFYRTALYIAGKTPVWWQVPPQEEQNYSRYVQYLQENKLLSEHETIDFGGLEEIPAEEFVTATLWQLFKSLSSPYKSLLKLLLMECYACEYPNPKWLCLEAKEAIYQGLFDLDNIDPYVLIYHKIEEYLSVENDPDRLNFARQCFYLKIMGDMEEQAGQQKLTYRKAIIDQMAERYRWPRRLIAGFSENNSWDIQKASKENHLIMRQLKMCYQMISLFSNTNVSLSINQDIQPLGRKLKFFLQKRPGKIDIIMTRSSIRNKENTLTLIESSHSSIRPTWDLFLGSVAEHNPDKVIPFKKGSRSLVELLSWLVSNELYQESLNLEIYATRQIATKIDINQSLKSLKSFLFNHKLGNLTELPAFKQPSRIIAHLLLLNLDDAPPINIAEGKLIFNNDSDILSYGTEKESFVHTIDQVSISSWGEVTCNRYQNLEGLFNCFITCFNQHSQSLPTKIECYTPIHGKSIAVGIKNLFIQLNDLFSQQQNQGSPRLIISGESAFYIFQQKESFLHYKKASDLEALSIELAEAQISFNTVHFNNATLSDTPLPFIYSFAKPNAIHVFCYSQEKHINLYIIDEKGSLFSQRYSNTSTQQLLTAYSNFLETLYDKGILESTLVIEYYALSYSAKNNYSATKITPPLAFAWDYLNIRITGEVYGTPPEILYSVYCNELEFSPTEISEDVFYSVASYIYNIRQSKEKYPIHITEIDVPLQTLGVNNYQQLQSVHFLQYKQKIEAYLNSTNAEASVFG
ncbi:MAG: adenylate cyclase [Methyloprofundus sp.]|nr:adenylate cyclase [Methyloprofundus sp.]